MQMRNYKSLTLSKLMHSGYTVRTNDSALPASCPMTIDKLPPEALPHVAAYFQALSEPTRLHILSLLQSGEHSVGDLARLVGVSAANASRHLALLCQHGLIERQSRGNSVYYRIADPAVYALCELVCGSIGRRFKQMESQQAVFALPAAAPAKPAVASKRAEAATRAAKSRR